MKLVSLFILLISVFSFSYFAFGEHKGPGGGDGLSCRVIQDKMVVEIKQTVYTYSIDTDLEAECVYNDKLAALYDGDDFIVFDSQLKTFKTYGADNNISNTSLSVGTGVAAMYDNDEFIVYQSGPGFSYYSTDDDYPMPLVVTGNQIAMTYDGDEVVSYCAGEFKYINAGDNKSSTGFGNSWEDHVGIYVGSEQYFLYSSNCEVRNH